MRDYLSSAKVYNLSLSPTEMHFIFADRVFNSLGLLILIFLANAFSVTDHYQQGILVKGGNGCWIARQSLTLIPVVFFWLAEMRLFLSYSPENGLR